MSPSKKLSKRDDQLSSYGVVDVVDNVALAIAIEFEIDSRTYSIEIFDSERAMDI